jgi:DNA-binding NarL/FixJ family response regulator
MHGDEALIAEAFRCGASAYILKQSAGEELIAVIKAVSEGGSYVSPSIGVEDVSEKINSLPKMGLTPRQREVLQLIAQGLTMKQIASRLCISTRTAESHKYEMMYALGMDNTAELIRYAIALGLVSH